MKTKNEFLHFLEWEFFEWPEVITNLKPIEGYSNLSKDSVIEITRNHEYKLTGKIQGVIAPTKDVDALNFTKGVKGELLTEATIEGQGVSPNHMYEMSGLLIGAKDWSFDAISSAGFQKFKADISLSKLKWFNPSQNDVNKHIDFYLTSKINQVFNRNTSRHFETSFKKIRNGVDLDFEAKPYYKTSGGLRDYIYVSTEFFDFIIQKVEKGFLPGWANGIQIEYRKTFKRIPDQSEREAIAEITGFILGSHITYIGSSSYDSAGIIIKQEAVSPNNNVTEICSNAARAPIKKNEEDNRYTTDLCLSQVIPIYLEINRKYNLSDTLWKYWIAKEVPIGTNLPILSSALETLAKSYLTENGLIKVYTEDEKRAYASLIREEVASLQSKLKEYTFCNQVIEKLKDPYLMSGNEKMKFFFHHLGISLKPKSIERKALAARNTMSHESIESDRSTIEKYIRLTNAYESLFHRVILKILHYKGEYIDYYTPGHPSKKMNENLEKDTVKE